MDEQVAYKFTAKDGKIFTLSKNSAQQSSVIMKAIESFSLKDDESIKNMEPIPLLTIDSHTFEMLKSWLEFHENAAEYEEGPSYWLSENYDEDLDEWEVNFITDLSNDELFDMIMAADYLDIKSLTHKCAEGFAKLIEFKSAKEISKRWRITMDFSSDEAEEMKTEDPWEVVMKPHKEVKKRKKPTKGPGPSRPQKRRYGAS
ncbi:unnamed protein product, partial [Mesorhabditis belari]|uniref:Skp1-related protein n=1 Tax=Mesorhabditis belari TaxID=2138241 RepID=A0AAF3EV55_9BILA